MTLSCRSDARAAFSGQDDAVACGVLRAHIPAAAVSFAVAGLFGLAGCSDQGEGGVEELPRLWAASSPESTSGFLPRVSGVLDYDEDLDCFLLEAVDGLRYPVVWPAGTTASSEPGVTLPTGQLVSIGDEVRGGGGYFPPPARYEIPAECLPDTGDAAVFNASLEVQVIAGDGSGA